jgi:hypothetical protein
MLAAMASGSDEMVLDRPVETPAGSRWHSLDRSADFLRSMAGAR